MALLIDVAGMHIALSCEPPLQFAPDRLQFRGFACQRTDNVDLNVIFRCVDGDAPMFPSGNQYFDCPRDYNNPESLCSWRIYRDSHGVETFVTQFDTQVNANVAWLRLTLSGNRATIDVCRRASDYQHIDPYQHPLFSLALSRLLLRRRATLIHSSVVDDGGGYLFTAPSGTGKSTMAQLWQSCGAKIVNDDMLAVRVVGDEVVAGNIPMPYYIDTQRTVALKGIFLISQSTKNFIRSTSGSAAVLQLLSNTIYHPFEPVGLEQHIRTVDDIARRVPIFELGFRPDTDIVDAVRKLKLI